MDRRSWPWKKKSSEKNNIEKALSSLETPCSSAISQGNQKQDNYKKPNYVQISLESYSHLTGLEDQVKSYVEQVKSYEDQVKTYENQVQTYDDQVRTYEDQVNIYEEQVKSLDDELKEVNEKLSEAQTEITNKEALVKQHVKVAEEAVSGWEKAEAEALSLKDHLESVTLLKLASDDRSLRLDDALKECLNQIRTLNEEHQQQLHEVILTKTKQCDKIKLELETKINNLTQELLRADAENSAVSRSLQERSNMLFKVGEEKSRAEAEIELLRSNLESGGKEINSLKYELHIARKEFEIRNEEKNMAVKSAEAANKQHLEGIKKIAKLEAEIQRLRGLVRKKLPGPAALAQMKLEVESLDRDYGDTTKKSPVKSLEFTLDGIQKSHKENEFLTKRLLAMEEETKMLKEALSKRNSELLASRNYCAQTVNKLRSLESELEANIQQKITLSSHSFVSISEDGNDDEMSCTASVSGLSHPKKDESEKHLDIMDDFLAMEKLACTPNESNTSIAASKSSTETVDAITRDLRISIYSIREFLMGLQNEAKSNQFASPDKDEFIQKIKGFCVTFDKFMKGELALTDVVLDLSHVLDKAREFKSEVVGYMDNYTETIGSDCIDKVAIPEDKDVQDTNRPIYSNACAHFPYSSSDANIPHQGSCSSAEEFEKLKDEKDNMVLDLARCSEDLESTKKLLEEVKLQLASAQKQNSLSDTQLKCMVESYKSLETQSKDLQTQADHLRAKIEILQNELHEERRCHQDAVARCEDLEKQLQRSASFSVAGSDSKPDQERKIAAATDKLADCQETIFLLGKQLESLRSQTEPNGLSHSKGMIQNAEIPTISKVKTISKGKHSLDFDQMVRETFVNEAPVEIFNSSFSPSNTESISPVISPIKSKHIKHRHTKSGSSTLSSGLTPEKHSRGYTRFFSGKGENGC